MLRWLCVCALLFCGCAAPLGDRLLSRADSTSAVKTASGHGDPSPSAEIAAQNPPAPIQVSHTPHANELPSRPTQLPQVTETAGSSTYRPNSSDVETARQQTLLEIEQALTKDRSRLSSEHQRYLRDQLLAILGTGIEAADPNTLVPPPATPNRDVPASQTGQKNVLPGLQENVALPAEIDRSEVARIADAVPRAGAVLPTAGERNVQPAAYVGAEQGGGRNAGVQTPAPPPNLASPIANPTSVPVGTGVVQDDIRPGQWRTNLDQARDMLEKELARFPHEEHEKATLTAYVRLLHAIANHRDQAVAAIDALPNDEREYWKHQLHALVLALDAENKHAPSRRAALVLRELRSAVDHLSNLSTLDVRNLALCTKVDSYGQFTEFRTQSFRPGDEVLLYVEIDNFAAEPVGDKFETELRGAYVILDAAGERLANVELPRDHQQCENRRRDYFIAYDIFLPKDIRSGSYTLQLTIEDVKGHKSSQGSIDFRVR